MRIRLLYQRFARVLAAAAVFVAAAGFLAVPLASAGSTCGDSSHGGSIDTSIDFGCKGQGNPITDMAFAIIRFLTNGVGVVLVASTVYAGIQYSASRGDPKAVAQSIKRIRANVVALLLFAFAYAFLNYIVPGQIFQ